MRISDGAKTRRVRMMIRFKVPTSSLGEFGEEIERSIFGIETISAPCKPNTKKSISVKALMLSPFVRLCI